MSNLNDIKVSVDADLFARVASCVSDEKKHYSLNGVYIEPLDGGGVVMVSTGGDPTVEDGPMWVFVSTSQLVTWLTVPAREAGKKAILDDPI